MIPRAREWDRIHESGQKQEKEEKISCTYILIFNSFEKERRGEKRGHAERKGYINN